MLVQNNYNLSPFSRYNAALLLERKKYDTSINLQLNIKPVNLYKRADRIFNFEERPANLPIVLSDNIIACLAMTDTIFSEMVTDKQHIYFVGSKWLYNLLQQNLQKNDAIYIDEELFNENITMLSSVGLIYYFDIPHKYHILYPHEMVLRLNGWGRKYYESWLVDKKEIGELEKIIRFVYQEVENNMDQYKTVYYVLKNSIVEEFDKIKNISSELEIQIMV